MLSERLSVKNVVFYTLTFIIVAGGLMALNPLRLNEQILKKHLLKSTPLGTTKDVVLTSLHGRKLDFQIFEPEQAPDNVKEEERYAAEDTGIEAKLGTFYTFHFKTEGVFAYWEFDDNDHLVNIAVWKSP